MIDKQNYEKDINVPRKDQIIIDGVDVSKCILRMRKEPNCTVCNGYSSKVFEFDCSDFKNCGFKQLARKTQECEELKNNLHIANTNHEAAEKECDRYLEALEEIEDICNVADRYELEELQETIFNIINKAKGEE